MVKKLLQGLMLTTLIVFLSFAYLSYRYFPKDAWGILTSLDVRGLVLAMLFLFLYHFFDMLRVIVIARAVGINYSPYYGFLISFVHTFGATVTPAHLGGEFLPLYTLSRRGGEFYRIATIVTLKGLTGIFFYILFFPLTLKSLIVSPKLAKELILILFSILLLSLMGYFIYLFLRDRGGIIGKKVELIKSLRHSLKRYLVTCRRFYREEKLTFILAVLLSIALYLTFLAIGVALLKAFNPSAPMLSLFLRQLPLLYAIFMSPTPGGSGVGEFGAIPVFSEYLPEDHLGIFIMLWRWASQYLSALIGGFIFLFFLAKDVAESHRHS